MNGFQLSIVTSGRRRARIFFGFRCLWYQSSETWTVEIWDSVGVCVVVGVVVGVGVGESVDLPRTLRLVGGVVNLHGAACVGDFLQLEISADAGPSTRGTSFHGMSLAAELVLGAKTFPTCIGIGGIGFLGYLRLNLTTQLHKQTVVFFDA